MAAKKNTPRDELVKLFKSDIRGAVAPKVKDGRTRNPLRGDPAPGRNEVMYIGEPGSDPGLRRAIAAEMAVLGAVGVKHSEAQRRNSNPGKTRGAINGRTMKDLVKTLARSNPGSTASGLWDDLGSTIKDWAEGCEEVGTKKKPQYKYPFPGSKDGRTITLKQFRDVLREARKQR